MTTSSSLNPTNTERSVDSDSERLYLDASETTNVSLDVLEAKDVSGEPSSEESYGSRVFKDLDYMGSIADFIHSLTDYEKQRYEPKTGQLQEVEQIKVDMPIELRVSEDESGQVVVKASAPSQRTETTHVPVFHRMQLRIVKDRDGH